ncbi:hypothetical protein GALMADRAFT_486580 [Galerina marginata CBS 339.88]|uniref:4Fe-4S ferredoxin-type domain-containing protein n=1 Tax=Galerina marginata (strain CBS 339.88) TaxID=685588 RepID=A0A067SZR4_GALM3|nr:hypothetical protein GALMADRAFT_486580 [Galerina marginata CBS 339.88]
MKSFFAAAIVAISLIASTNAVPQATIGCASDVCLLNRPVCPAGSAPTGGPGCWRCCQPICRPSVCASTSPICLEAETLTAPSLGCWRCCRPVCGTGCSIERPVCVDGYAVSGGDGCWSCCPIIASD